MKWKLITLFITVGINDHCTNFIEIAGNAEEKVTSDCLIWFHKINPF